MATNLTKGRWEAAEEYKRLRRRYDAAFRELTRRTHHQQELMATGGAGSDSGVDSSVTSVREHRNRIAEFLLRDRGQVQQLDSQRQEAAVQEAAYFRWLNAGCPVGTSMSDWIAAQQQLSADERHAVHLPA